MDNLLRWKTAPVARGRKKNQRIRETSTRAYREALCLIFGYALAVKGLKASSLRDHDSARSVIRLCFMVIGRSRRLWRNGSQETRGHACPFPGSTQALSALTSVGSQNLLVTFHWSRRLSSGNGGPQSRFPTAVLRRLARPFVLRAKRRDKKGSQTVGLGGPARAVDHTLEGRCLAPTQSSGSPASPGPTPNIFKGPLRNHAFSGKEELG